MTADHCKRKLVAAALALSILSSATAVALDDPRYAAIDALGELNGIALQCKYIKQVRRMKFAVVLNAPKERSFGLAFDQAANRSFLRFIEQQQPCPNADNFARRVGHQIDTVREVFKAAQK